MSKSRLNWIPYTLLCLCAAAALANDSKRPTSAPYSGDLSIFEDPKRAKNLQVNRVMDLLGIHRGSHVADIGAGSGWFTIRAARRVGKEGLVYAVEINPAYIAHIEARAKKTRLANIRTVLGKADDPLLPSESVDAVLLLKTYHEVAEPIALLRHVREAMRPNAKLGIIDKKGKGDDHGLDAGVVTKEVMQAGFRLVGQYDFVKPDKVDYFLLFERDSDERGENSRAGDKGAAQRPGNL